MGRFSFGSRFSHPTMGLALAAAVAAACGSGSNATKSPGDAGVGASDGGGVPSLGGDGGLALGSASVTSIEVDPPTASIQSLNGATATQTFSVTAHYADGSSGPVASGVSWTTAAPRRSP